MLDASRGPPGAFTPAPHLSMKLVLLALSACLLVTLPAAQRAERHAGPVAARGGVLPLQRDLAGKPLARYPHFRFTQSFNAGEPIRVAFDARTDAFLGKRYADVFVIDHADLPRFLAGEKLASVTGPPLSVRIAKDGGVRENTFLLDPGTLSGKVGPDADGTYVLGRGYDVIVDLNASSTLDAFDLIDGGPDGAGFHVVEDFVSFKRPETLETGPYPVTEVLFNAGTRYTRQNIYFPTDIGLLGELPLVVVSHGNGHSYVWYDHIGYHLASWGYVVMSHANDTGPGIETASTSTLRNTNVILARTAEIADGALVGHIDAHSIVWIGHSRGGEGVVRAYRRLIGGTTLATAYGVEDIRLVSSIAPTDFLGPGVSDMGSAPYHLWTGGADADVNGCANCDICQTFHLLERADGARFSTSLHGAGHAVFHAGGGSLVAQGPCLIGTTITHAIMRAYLLPLVQHALDGNPACLDYLTRQWEEFRALGAPDPAVLPDYQCVVVDLMYVPDPASMRVVLDDFQTQSSPDRSSSGGDVLRSPALDLTYREGRLDDANLNFTSVPTDPMNGMTFAGPGDTSRGCVLEWDSADEWLMLEVPAGMRDLRGLGHLSFRAAQSTRHPLTVAELGGRDVEVQLTDSALRASTIRISAYGGGIEEPYQRGTCGMDVGWANEFETIRIPLADFRRDGVPLNLADVVAVTFLFGPAHGSPVGRIGLDEIELTLD
jgi:hypothetical protein